MSKNYTNRHIPSISFYASFWKPELLTFTSRLDYIKKDRLAVSKSGNKDLCLNQNLLNN